MSEYKLDKIPIDKIYLDNKNPRIPKSLHNGDQHEIMSYMIANASVTELMKSICENDYFLGEPLIVIPVDSDNAEKGYTVVEGNRRVTALKLLHNPELATFQKNKIKSIASNTDCTKPKLIPSLIANDHNEVQKYLGFRHITGVKNWKALEKARYLYYLQEELLKKKPNLLLRELSTDLAAMIGSRADYVKRVIIAYRLYLLIEENDFFEIEYLNDTTFYFTNLLDSLNRKNIATFLFVDFNKNDPLEYYHSDASDFKHLKEWCEWLFEKNAENKTRVKSKSDQLTMLASIVGNERALEEFREGKSLKDAAFLTEHADQLFSESITKSIDYIKHAFNIAYNIDDFPLSLDDNLKEIVKICRDINAIKESRGKDPYEL